MDGLHPIGDQVKIKLDATNPYGFKGDEGRSSESGILVEMPPPKSFGWLGYHSFAFDKSLGNPELLATIYESFAGLKDKRVFWEQLQDRGRVVQIGEDQFVLLKMTDIIAYSDEVDLEVKTVNQAGKRGSFSV